RLETRPPGYVLRVDVEELDLDCFTRLLEEADGVSPVLAAERLREALALWRGPALADLAYEPFAQADRKSTRLNSSHVKISYAVLHPAPPSFPTRRSSDLRLETRPPGYVLRVDVEELDLDCFTRLLEEADGVSPVLAAERLREALALWRGPALADLAYEPFAQ